MGNLDSMLRQMIVDIGGENAVEITDVLSNEGIREISDFAVICNDDIDEVFSEVLRLEAILLRDTAKLRSEGWAKMTARSAA